MCRSLEYGFTIIELVIVLILLGIISVLGLNYFAFQNSPFEDSNTHSTFESSLSFSRHKAVATQCAIEIRINSNNWTVWHDNNCNMSEESGSCPPSHPLSFTVAVNKVGEPTQLSGKLSLDSSSGNSIERLIFTPQGRLYRINSTSTGCDALPANAVPAGTPITNLIPSATLQLDGLTGYATFQ